MQMGPEQLFRLAVNSGENNLDVTSVAQQGAQFETNMNNLVKSNPAIATGAIAGIAIVATVAAACLAYRAMAQRLDTVHDERENYQDMIEQGISTYFLAQDRQKRHPWDHYVAGYITKLQETTHPTLNDLLSRYAGVHQKTIDHPNRKGTVYGVISTFATPLGIYFPHTADDLDQLTQARKFLNILTTGELKERLIEVEAKLKPGWLTEMKLITDAERYLPWLNATRLVLISLGNIASNLIFAMNPNTGMPLSYEDSAALCSLFRELIGTMRSDMINNVFHQNRSSLCCYQSFNDFLSILDSRILVLKKSYEYNAENRLNLNEVSNSAYLMLQQLNTSLRALIYLNQPFSEPVHLMGKIIDLADLIYFHPELVPELVSKLKLPENFNYAAIMVNTPPTTAMDLLILWSDAPKKTRSHALSNMQQDTEWRQQFVKTLHDIKKYFIKPIESKTITKHFGGLYRTSKISLSPARLFFITSIALLMEVYRLRVIEPQLQDKQGMNQQIRNISAQAISPNALYGMETMLELLLHEESTRNALKKVFILIFEMLPLLKAIDYLDIIRQNNQRAAGKDEFQAVLLERLKCLKNKQKELLKAIDILIETAEGEKKSDKDSLRILTSLNNTNAKTALSIPQIGEELEGHINHSMQMLIESTYDDISDENEKKLIDMFKNVDHVKFYESTAAYQNFYRSLYEGFRSKNLLPVPTPELAPPLPQPTVDNPLVEEPVNLPSLDVEKTASTNLSQTQEEAHIAPSEKTSYSFQWRALSVWLSRLSIALLLIGLFLVLLMAFGAQTIPAIAALSTPVATGIVIGGLVSAAAGGFGLAATYYTPRLFKSTPLPALTETRDGTLHVDNKGR